MDDLKRKAQIKQTFDTVAEGYGTTGMEFFHNAAAHLPRIFKLQGHEHLLDVAVGTGIAATAIAPHLPRGKVIGIDLSEGMLAQARARAHSQALDNIELHSMDMQNIDFDNAYFDAANCSFGLFFLPDMLSLLQHIASKVKVGGQVVACSFYQTLFFKLGKRALFTRGNRAAQLFQRLGIVGEALLPADIEFFHEYQSAC